MARYNYVYEWEGDDTQPFERDFRWKSKTFMLPVSTNFSCARVIAETGDRQDYYDAVAARDEIIKANNAALSAGDIGGLIGNDLIGVSLDINGDGLADVPTVGSYSGDFSLSVNFYADGTLKFTKDVYATDLPFRIGGGAYRGRTWEFEIEGNVTVRRFDMAQDVRELKQAVG